MQLFVVGPPRSGTTIVAQFLNAHHDIKIFDEVDLIEVGRYGPANLGTLQALFGDSGVCATYQRHFRAPADLAADLHSVMSEIASPCTIWGEKNPMYATRLDVLRRRFPDAVVLFVLRDPRQVVNSYLRYRDSPSRACNDYWIKDSVTEALAQLEHYLEPLEDGHGECVVLRYEAFQAQPKATLDAALGRWGLSFADSAVASAHPAPETFGDKQFFRDGAVLPWKVGNLSALRQDPPARVRLDDDDPAWEQVDALARRFGYT